MLNQTEIDGEVIVCEGPKDNAPAFSRREKVGPVPRPTFSLLPSAEERK
jgi:fructose-1,6-bisphosphatase/sedoheptulose 1,7-bisphosphatase-like protein